MMFQRSRYPYFEMKIEIKIKKSLAVIGFLTLIVACNETENRNAKTHGISEIQNTTPAKDTIAYPIADSFDFPVGKPDAKGYYNAQPFTENNHLGDDWNAVTGGNSDLGHPIYAIANGVVTAAADEGAGWGNVIRIEHHVPNEDNVESLYAHCLENRVKKGDIVKKGQQIATIGNADGAYLAHLHFEIRKSVGMPLGPGYSTDTTDYLNPTEYIKAHR